MCLTVFLASCNGDDNEKENNEEKENDEEKAEAILAQKYDKAFSLIEQEKYQEAYELFEELGDYKDAQKELKKFHYIPTKATNTAESFSATVTMTYNELNLPKQMLYKDSDDDTSTYDYSFDDNGNVLMEVYTDYDGGKYIYDYTYDDKGHLIKEVYTYSEDNKSFTDYTYDDNGNVVKVIWSDSNGDYEETCEIEYKFVYIPFEFSDEEFNDLYMVNLS